MATDKTSFTDRTLKRFLPRFSKSGETGPVHTKLPSSKTGETAPAHTKLSSSKAGETAPAHTKLSSSHKNNTEQGQRSTIWYVDEDQKEIDHREITLDECQPDFLLDVSGKGQTTKHVKDESVKPPTTKKNDSPPDSLLVELSSSLERSGSIGSKKKVKPEGTFEYVVKNSDTLSSIAAHFDVTPSELKKLNKLTSQYIFPDQVLYIPSGEQKKKKEESVKKEKDVSSPPPQDDRPRMDVPIVKMADKPPAKVPGHAERQTPTTSPKDEKEFEIPHKLAEDEIQQLDQDCYERFIKVNVKHITDGQGVVSGVLLVTPNAVMFDPNVSDPLVKEHGADTYGVIAPMDMIISCAMYHDIDAMNRRKYKDSDSCGPRPEVYHDTSCPHYASWVRGHSEVNLNIGSKVISEKTSPSGNSDKSESASICSCGAADQKLSPIKSPISNKLLTNQNSPQGSYDQSFEVISQSSSTCDAKDEKIDPTKKLFDEKDIIDCVEDKKVTVTPDLIDLSEMDNKSEKFFLDEDDSVFNQNSEENVNKDASPEKEIISNLNSPSSESNGNKSPGEMRIGNIVYMPVSENSNGELSEKEIENVKTTLSRLSLSEFESRDRSLSTPVDVPVVSMTTKKEPVTSKSFSGSLPSLSPHINSFVNYATGLFKPESKADIKDVSEMAQGSPRNFSSSGTNLEINMTEHDFAVAVESAVKLADKPELFQAFDKLIPKPAVSFDDPPLYLCIRLGKPIKGEVSKTCPIAAYNKHKKKPEYWFSIPREKVDPLYAFFVQWKPEIYGDDEEMMAEKRGFVVLSEEGDDAGDIEILEEYFAGGSLQKDWEIISTEEMLKRKSIDVDVMPELLNKSSVLEDYHLEMLNTVMPPRTVGYPWSLIYSTEKHGFSLKTMYRHMHDIDSPILLIVKDTGENVFGAMTSCELKVSDHFYGTGESFLFTFYPDFKVFRWTGENNFFMKGNQESLSIGAGQGQFGLWFDGDIYHGRTNHCETYDNDLLTTSEDFVVSIFEAWAFTDD